MYASNSTMLSHWSARQVVRSQHEIFRDKERRRERIRASIEAEGRRWARCFSLTDATASLAAR